jgi:hypothetical protein
MSNKLNPDRKLIIQKYVIENKSLNITAKELGCGRTTLSRYLKRYNIKKRDRYELHRKIFSGSGNPFYNKKHTKETRDAISKTMIDNGTTKGKNNPAFKYDISKEFLLEEYTKEGKTPPKIADKVGCHRCTILRDLKKYNIQLRPLNIEKKELFKGENSPSYKHGIYSAGKKYYCKTCHINEISLSCFVNGNGNCTTCAGKLRGPLFAGENNPQWIDGRSYFPYPQEFNQDLKDKIRKRDDYICRNCGITEEEYLIIYGRNLDIHHIDYNKFNCVDANLITLCTSCNIRANFNRSYWLSFFQNKIGQIKCRNIEHQ